MTRAASPRSAKRGQPASRSAALFAALGDETRLRIVGRLSDRGPMSIAQLTAGGRVSRQAVTKHLRRMQRAGLLQMTKSGREAVWQLQPDRLEEARSYLRAISDRWDTVLGSLQRFVES